MHARLDQTRNGVVVRLEVEFDSGFVGRLVLYAIAA